MSPTVAQLAAGDANCPAGGAAIADAAGSTAYVCSGQDGQDGADFSGSFASSNGLSTLVVDDTGIKLHTPGGQLNLGTLGVELKSVAQLKIEAATELILKGATVAIN